MKLKALFGAMLALGLVSSAAMADSITANNSTSNTTTANATQVGLYGTNYVWNTIIDRNADNAYGEVALYAGQTEVTGVVAVDFAYSDTSSGASSGSPSAAQFSLNNAEIYVDSQFNSWIRAHIAMEYSNDFTQSSNTASTTPDMFFDEAYVTMYGGGNFYAKVGRQFLNFGSYNHQSLTTPLPQVLSQTNATAVTLGVVNLTGNPMVGGLYLDASVFNGGQYGTQGSTAYNNSAVQANGIVADLGYTQQAANQHYNVYVDYIDNMASTLTLNYGGATCGAVGTSTCTPGTFVGPFAGTNAPYSLVGGVAAHADYTTGPFTLMGDYVSALTAFNPNQWAYNGAGAKPSAYSAEADYNFMLMNHKSTVMLGYAGSSDMAGLYPVGSSTPMPQTRFLIGYSYALMSHVYLQAEYDNDRDYGADDTSAFYNSSTSTNANGGEIAGYQGTGNNDNTLTLRLKVQF